MTLYTEFLEREPFYTYFGAFTPEVPILKIFSTPCTFTFVQREGSNVCLGYFIFDLLHGEREVPL